MADAGLFQVFLHRRDRLADSQAVQEAGVDHDAGIVLEGEGFLLDVPALDDLDDLAAELLCERPVAVVMRRDCHDGAGTIGHKDIVGDEDGDLLARHGVDGAHALDAHAGLFLVELGTLKV